MHMVGLYDRISLTPARSGIVLRCPGHPDLPRGRKNLAYRAAELLRRDSGLARGVRIVLEKNIPVGAGMGGGSSDAAAVLKGINRLFRLGYSPSDLAVLGARLGSDVPFFLGTACAVASGRGENLIPSPALPKAWVVLANPRLAVSTGWVYNRYSQNRGGSGTDGPRRFVRKAKKMLTSLSDGNNIIGFHSFGSNACPLPAWFFRNDLQRITQAEYPVVAEMVREMRALGAHTALMTGSGPTVFGMFADRGEAIRAHRSIISRRSWAAWVTETLKNVPR